MYGKLTGYRILSLFIVFLLIQSIGYTSLMEWILVKPNQLCFVKDSATTSKSGYRQSSATCIKQPSPTDLCRRRLLWRQKTYRGRPKISFQWWIASKTEHPRFLIENGQLCQSRNISIIFFILSSPDHVALRNHVRTTWGSVTNYAGFNILVIFGFGIGSPEEQQILSEENDVFGDIIQQNFKDTYSNLTLKTLMGLEWTATYCSSAKYLVKIDDDFFINIFGFINRLRESPVVNSYNRTFFCKRWEKAKPNKLFRTLGFYPDLVYPPYCSGAIYIMTTKMAKELLGISKCVKRFPVEDIYVTGILPIILGHYHHIDYYPKGIPIMKLGSHKISHWMTNHVQGLPKDLTTDDYLYMRDQWEYLKLQYDQHLAR